MKIQRIEKLAQAGVLLWVFARTASHNYLHYLFKVWPPYENLHLSILSVAFLIAESITAK
ncbi:hypothetical protein CsSME_00016291 [Camellia sinensis var. sinensis]